MGMDSNLLKFKNGVHYLNPNSSGLVFSKKVFIDKNGYRVPSKDFKYTKKRNFVIIGDSTAFGNGVEEEETFVGLIRKKNENFNVYNTSVPGYDLFQYEKTLENIKKINNIEKIFYFVTLNDVLSSETIVPWQERNQEKLKTELGLIQKIVRNKYLRNLNHYLRNKSYIFMYLKGVFTDPSKRWFANIKIFYEENDINHLSNYLKKLSKISKEKKANLHIFVLPYEYQTRFCKSKKYLVPQKKIKDQFNILKIQFFDFYQDFCKFKKPDVLFYKFDPMHLSTKGHKLVYNVVNREINF